MTERGPVLVIDIGGTKMAAGVAEPGGRLIAWDQVPTPHDADTDAEQLWLTLEALLLHVLKAPRFSTRPSCPASAAAAAARWSGRRAWSRR